MSKPDEYEIAADLLEEHGFHEPAKCLRSKAKAMRTWESGAKIVNDAMAQLRKEQEDRLMEELKVPSLFGVDRASGNDFTATHVYNPRFVIKPEDLP